MSNYYFDTSIWIDILENRKDFSGKAIGKYGRELLTVIIINSHVVVVSDETSKELSDYCGSFMVNALLTNLGKNILKVVFTDSEKKEALRTSQERNVPFGDALHAIIARDTSSVLIARDNHFNLLDDVCPHFKPEDLLK
jgi:predicted nucleic acid-binding protein